MPIRKHNEYRKGKMGVNFVEPIRDINKLEEMKQVLKERGSRDYFLFVLGINSGLRVSDLLKMKVKDIKNLEIRLKETKTRKQFSLSLNHIKDEIEEYIFNKGDEEYLFKSSRGDYPINRVQAYKILSKAGDYIGLRNIGCHSMRKSFGYHHYKRNKDVAILMNIYNHSSEDVTLRYLGISGDVINKSLEGFKL